ncbi:putative Ralf-like 34 [Hibiscus syriacus]|uniref:Ralf-like 34 n=1 Tax=Hibiscus syriacus TaxID=106335 RepID=A0A6A2WDK8_HIBSY|nr:putative Ralf-like 34 [Hibiscus syriacus]
MGLQAPRLTPPIYPNPINDPLHSTHSWPCHLPLIIHRQCPSSRIHGSTSSIQNKLKYPSLFNNSNSYPPSVDKKNSMAAVREMIFRIVAMQPIHIDPESIKAPKRRNVKIPKDPQSGPPGTEENG